MVKVTAWPVGSETRYEIEDDDEHEVEDAIDRVKASYHPLGYGTHFSKPEQRADGSWIARGQRWNSCD